MAETSAGKDVKKKGNDKLVIGDACRHSLFGLLRGDDTKQPAVTGFCIERCLKAK